MNSDAISTATHRAIEMTAPQAATGTAELADATPFGSASSSRNSDRVKACCVMTAIYAGCSSMISHCNSLGLIGL